MPGVENYQRHPGRKLEKALATCDWKEVGPGLWEKGQSRLFVDPIGIFLYQVMLNWESAYWLRTHGLAHNRIFINDQHITFRDLSTLNLVNGEWRTK